MKGDNIAERLLAFAAGVLDVIAEFPRSVAGNHVARQLARCGTSGGANYEEARGAESTADFAHKVDVAAKEARESVYWLKLAERARLSRNPQLHALIGEGNELAAILRRSGRTARARSGEQPPAPFPVSSSQFPVPSSQFSDIDASRGEG
jgi:four helix bundle protein